MKIIIYFFSFCCFAQIKKENILNYQKSIIEQELTGSNRGIIFQNGEVIFDQTVNSNKNGDLDINEETIFPIWSMSKPITIVAMMSLIEKGIIDLEDPVYKYIPSFKNINCKGNNSIYPCKNELKIIHLMSHRSGFGYYSNPGYGYGFTNTIKYNNLEEFISDVAKVTLEFEPGSDYLYGINQAILGRIIEVVTKKSFFEYLFKTILDPLKMNNTKFHLTDEEKLRFQPLYINHNSLKGFTYELNKLSYSIDNRAHFGGEGLVSTASDYMKFCKMLLNKGIYNGKRIISEKSIKIMTDVYSEKGIINGQLPGKKVYYGFSFFVVDPVSDGIDFSKRLYGWDGYHCTRF